MQLLKPKTITLKDLDGDEKTFLISRIPCIAARKMITQYPVTAMPKVGDYQINETLMLELMCYVAAIKDDGSEVQLKTKHLIENHVSDGEMLMKLEYAMMDYNTAFFKAGKISKGLSGFAAKLVQSLTQTLTHSSQSSSAKTKRPSKS